MLTNACGSTPCCDCGCSPIWHLTDDAAGAGPFPCIGPPPTLVPADVDVDEPVAPGSEVEMMVAPRRCPTSCADYVGPPPPPEPEPDVAEAGGE